MLTYMISLPISYFLISNVLSSRFQLILKQHSVAEIMGKLYSKTIRKTVAIIGLLHNVAFVSCLLSALTKFINVFYEISEFYSLFIALIFILFNSECGRIQKVSTLREMIRCVMLTLLLPVIVLVLWKKLIGQYGNDLKSPTKAFQTIWNTLTKTSTLPVSHWSYIGLLIGFLTIFSLPNLSPPQMQRILIAENAAQVKRSYNAAGWFLLGINLFLSFVFLLFRANKITLFDPNLKNFLSAYPGLKELFPITVIFLLANKASAYLHSSAVLLVNDLKIYLGSKDKQTVMHFSPYTMLTGMVAALFTYYGTMHIWLIVIYLFRTTVNIPLCISLIGICLHPYAIITGILGTTVATIVFQWSLRSTGDLLTNVIKITGISILIHLIVLTIAQVYFQRYKQQTSSEYCRKILTLQGTTHILASWKQKAISILRQLMKCSYWEQLQKQLPKDNLPYLFFSFYIIITGYGFFYTLPFNSNSISSIWDNDLEILVFFPSLFVATFFLFYVSTPPNPYLKNIATILWPLSNGYFLFIVGAKMLIMSGFNYISVVTLMLNFYLSILITSFPIIIISCIITLPFFSWLLSSYVKDPTINIECFWNQNSKFMFILLILSVLIGTLFYYKKRLYKLIATIQELSNIQEIQNTRQFFSKQHIEALAYESSYVLTELHQRLVHLIKSQETDAIHTIKQQALKLNNYFNSVFTHLKHNFYLTTNWISTDKLLEGCFDKVKINNIYNIPYVLLNTEHLYIHCDIERIKQLITNSIHSCILYKSLHLEEKKDIFIYINDTQLAYQLTLLQGKRQKIDAISFSITTYTQQPTILPLYKVIEMADIQILNKEKDKIDYENQCIINTHYGYCETTYSNREVMHLFVLPVNIQDITKAFATFSPVVYTQRLSPINKDEEAVFVKKLRTYPKINIQEIMSALQLIKTYYATQKRETGEPFYLHPVSVAAILSDLTKDQNIIMAGLLHDVVQNTPLTEAGLTTLVGEAISHIISEAYFIHKKLLTTDENDYLSYIHSLLNTPNHAYRSALLVMLADALHNAQTIHGHNIEKQKKKAHLIKNFYVPLAKQMGLNPLVKKLQHYANKVL
ncbi:HD domain-containing protein [Candidatus Cardinium hertigii]|nr:HD domain-containing protein [Candidatus Cardinium hertigii]